MFDIKQKKKKKITYCKSFHGFFSLFVFLLSFFKVRYCSFIYRKSQLFIVSHLTFGFMSSFWAFCWQELRILQSTMAHCNLKFCASKLQMWLKCRQNLMHFTSISSHFTFIKRKILLKRKKEAQHFFFCCGPSFLLLFMCWESVMPHWRFSCLISHRTLCEWSAFK